MRSKAEPWNERAGPPASYLQPTNLTSSLQIRIRQVGHDFVDQVKLFGFFSGHEVITIGVVFDFLKRFASVQHCLLYTSPSPRDLSTSRMPSSA